MVASHATKVPLVSLSGLDISRRNSKKLEKGPNLFPVLWTVEPLDWRSGSESCITEKIVFSGKFIQMGLQ